MSSAIAKAEGEINKILSDLEKETGDVIETIDLCRIDMTSVGDDRPKHGCSVKIETRRLPGNLWLGVK